MSWQILDINSHWEPFLLVFSGTKLGCSTASETSFHALTAPKIDGASGALIGSMLVGFPKYLGGGKAAAGWFNSCWHCSFSAICYCVSIACCFLFVKMIRLEFWPLSKSFSLSGLKRFCPLQIPFTGPTQRNHWRSTPRQWRFMSTSCPTKWLP